MRHIRLPLTVIVTAIALAAVVTTASANRLSLSENAFRVVFPEPTGEPPPHIILCAATFEGTFHARTFSKTSGSLVGYITRAAFREETCRGGKMIVLSELLPWHLQYESFTGTLPNITSFSTKVIGMAILAEFAAFPGSRCLITTTAEHPARAIFAREARGVLTSFRWDETLFIPTIGTCPETLFGVFGTTTVKTPAGASIVLTLI